MFGAGIAADASGDEAPPQLSNSGYARLGSKFVVGLMVFSVLLFVENIVAAYLYFGLAQSYGPPVAMPLLAINVFGILGLSAFLWTTLR